MPAHFDSLHLLLALLVLVLYIRCRRLEIDPNYGILTTAAGMWRVRQNRRRRGLILMDLDDFKGFNTQHGHTEADRRVRFAFDLTSFTARYSRTAVDQHMWQALKVLRFRRSDGVLIVRRGGDEIVVQVDDWKRTEFIATLAATRLKAVGLTASMYADDQVTNYDQIQPEAERVFLEMKRQGHKNAMLLNESGVARLVHFGANDDRPGVSSAGTTPGCAALPRRPMLPLDTP